MKKYVKLAVNKLGYDITKKPSQIKHEGANPSLYSAAEAGGTEVPCQKEAYYYALNNYVKEGDRVLDVGIGAGYGINLLSIKAKQLHGVDVDSKSISHCKKVILGKNPKVKKIQEYDGYKLPYKDNYFDVVTCVDVVEHVKEYNKFIDELLRVTKGTVVLATPNRRPEYTNEDGTPKNYWHLREWSYKELDKIVRRHSKKIDWKFIDGPWVGPFKIKDRVSTDTLVLMPILYK